MKVSELSGMQLDWAVFEAEHGTQTYEFTDAYRPSSNWAQGGPIIEREGIEVGPQIRSGWQSTVWKNNRPISSQGPTPLVAAMRCYVASKLGDEIDLPVEIRGHKEGCPAIDGFGCKCEEA
jgi:hypothetical protein